MVREENKSLGNKATQYGGSTIITRETDSFISGDKIVVIHGTFDRNADWCKAGHNFYDSLTEEFGEKAVSRFEWSGGNDADARIHGAKGLLDYISRLNLCGNQKAHLIAHSHGGNVILFAAHLGRFKQLVGSVCFMGTPFFITEKRELVKGLQFFVSVISWLMNALICLVLPFIPFFFLMECLRSRISETWLISIGTFLILLMILAFLAFYENYFNYLKGYLYRLIWPSLFSKHLETLDIHRIDTPSSRLLVSKISFDEASLLLKCIEFVSALPLQIWRQFRSLLPAYLLGFVFWNFISGFVNGILTGSWQRSPLISTIVVFLLFLAFLSLLLPLLYEIANRLLIRHKFGFGNSGWLSTLGVRVYTSDIPKHLIGSWTLLNITPKNVSTWRHCSFYNDHDFTKNLIRWLKDIDVGQLVQHYDEPKYNTLFDWYTTHVVILHVIIVICFILHVLFPDISFQLIMGIK